MKRHMKMTTTAVGIDSRGNLPASNFLGQRSAGARGLALTSPFQKPKGPWGLGGLESESTFRGARFSLDRVWKIAPIVESEHFF